MADMRFHPLRLDIQPRCLLVQWIDLVPPPPLKSVQNHLEWEDYWFSDKILDF